MRDRPRLVLLVVLGVLLVVGGGAWLFPERVEAVAGPRVFPVVAILATAAALALAAPWPVVRLCIGCLMVAAFLGWNPQRPASTSYLLGISLGVLIMIATARIVTTARAMRVVYGLSLVAGTGVLALGGAAAPMRGPGELQALFGGPPIDLGLTGLQNGFVNPNALAAAALLVAPLGLSAAYMNSGGLAGLLWRTAGVFVIGFGALVLGLCDSFTAWLAAGLTGCVALGATWRTLASPRAAGAVLLVCLLTAGLVLALGGGRRSLALLGAQNSVQERREIMTQGIDLLRQSPWLGIGLNEFRVRYRPSPSAAPHAHNMWLQTALDLGLVGAAAYWGLLAVLLAYAHRAYWSGDRTARGATVGPVCALVAVTFFGLADAVPLGAKIGVFQWAACGLILAGHRFVADSPDLLSTGGGRA